MAPNKKETIDADYLFLHFAGAKSYATPNKCINDRRSTNAFDGYF